MKSFLMTALIGIQIGYMIGGIFNFFRGGEIFIDGTFLVIPLIFVVYFLKEDLSGLFNSNYKAKRSEYEWRTPTQLTIKVQEKRPV